MTFTPSALSSAAGGAGIWAVAWSTLGKLDKIAKLLRIDSFVSQDAIIDWIDGNKVLTLVGTEVVNFGVHGVGNATGAFFALGGTLVNVFAVFFGVPLYRVSHRVFGSGR